MGPDLAKIGATFREQLPQGRSVASIFVLTVAPQRERRRVGKRGQEIEDLISAGPIDFRSKLTLKARPRLFIPRRLRLLDELLAGRKIGQPNIVKITTGIFRLWNSSRRSANGAQTQTLVHLPGRTKSDDPYWHDRGFTFSYCTPGLPSTRRHRPGPKPMPDATPLTEALPPGTSPPSK
jgi:hypothetical protein